MAPSPNGRSTNGQFRIGNAGGPGNPHASKVGKLRSALLAAVTPADIRKIVKAMVELAKSGDVASAKLVLDRTLGKVAAAVDPPSPVFHPGDNVTAENLEAAKIWLTQRLANLIARGKLADCEPLATTSAPE